MGANERWVLRGSTEARIILWCVGAAGLFLGGVALITTLNGSERLWWMVVAACSYAALAVVVALLLQRAYLTVNDREVVLHAPRRYASASATNLLGLALRKTERRIPLCDIERIVRQPELYRAWGTTVWGSDYILVLKSGERIELGCDNETTDLGGARMGSRVWEKAAKAIAQRAGCTLEVREREYRGSPFKRPSA